MERHALQKNKSIGKQDIFLFIRTCQWNKLISLLETENLFNTTLLQALTDWIQPNIPYSKLLFVKIKSKLLTILCWKRITQVMKDPSLITMKETLKTIQLICPYLKKGFFIVKLLNWAQRVSNIQERYIPSLILLEILVAYKK